MPRPPQTVIALAELASLRDSWRQEGCRVAFVPTMGALHEGHLSLVKAAKAEADRVIVSIFVNPLQFGPSEDFARYPRTLKADTDLLTAVGADALFLPNAATMYPDGFATQVVSRQGAEDLCGAHRPGHFDGVLTVVLKLFNLVQPHRALFGKKDYQQWRLIEKMVRDLNVPVTVVGMPTLREADGLAMSSRNRYLEPEERRLAVRLSQGLTAARAAWRAGERDGAALLAAFDKVVTGVPGIELEYVALRRQADLMPLAPDTPIAVPVVMLTAARIGKTRLIDNLEMD